MKIREITIKDVNYHRSFSPIREIILLSDDKWEKFVKDNSTLTIYSIESIFSINEIYPEGLSGVFKYELGRFMATLDTFQCSLSFLCLLINNKEFQSVINDYRIAIQNFQVYIENKSFYSAFMEFRKMLEGILWMRKIINDNIVPKIITKMKYQELLNQINPKFGDAYSKFNYLFHYHKEETPFMGINRIYNEKDHLYKFLNIIDDIANIYEDEINLFISSFNNKTWKRYKVILKKLDDARNSYNLRNYKIAPSSEIHFVKSQEKFASLILKYNPYKMQELKFEYNLGIQNIIYKKPNTPEYKTVINGIRHISNLYGSNFEKYVYIINPELIRSIKHFENLKNYKKDIIFKISKEICILLLEKEIKKGGSINIAFLRSIFEDILFNSAIKKNAFYMHTSLISDFLNKEYDVKTKKINKKYSHILRDDRIIYNKEIISSQEMENQKKKQEKLIIYLKDIKKIIDKL